MRGLVVVNGLFVVLDTVLRMLVLVMGNNSCVLVVGRTGMLLSLELDVGFFLMLELFVMGILVVGNFNMDGVVVDNARFVVVHFVVGCETLDVVVGVLVVIFVVSVLVMVAVAIVSIVTGLVMHWNDNSLVMDGNDNSLVVNNWLMNDNSLVMGKNLVVLVVNFVIRVGLVVSTVTVGVTIISRGSVVAIFVLPDDVIISVVRGWEVVHWDIVLHLTSKEDLGERKTDGVTELIEVLVLPLSLSIHNLVMDILSIDDEIVLNMEDKVPRVCEGL